MTRKHIISLGNIKLDDLFPYHAMHE